MSQTIRTLERRIGVPLFHRTSRRVELSPMGRRLRDEIEPAWAQIVDVLPWLSAEEVDMALAALPVHDSDLASGPVLIRERRMLAVPAGHPFAGRPYLSVEDLAQTTVMQFAGVPEAYRDDRTSAHTPGGKPIRRGASARTFNEVLTLVGAGQGVFPVAPRRSATTDVPTWSTSRSTTPHPWSGG